MSHYPRRRYLLLPLLIAAALRLHAQNEVPATVIGSIVGEVREKSGEIPDARFAIRIESTTIEAATADDGSFRIGGLARGSYTVIVSGEGYETQRIGDVSVGAEPVRLRLTARRRSALTRDPVRTVSRREQPLPEAPASITVIDRTELAARGTRTLDEALATEPGLVMNGSQINMRGASGIAFAAGSRVQLLIDGVSHMAPDNGRLPLDALPLGMIDRVEIVRGPGSPRYGSGAVSGVVNVIPQQRPLGGSGMLRLHGGLYSDPQREDWNWWDGNSQQFTGADGFWSQRGGNFGISIAGSYGTDDSYRQHDDIERYNLYGSLGWQTDPTTSLKLSALSYRSRHGGYYLWRNVDSALFAALPPGDVSPVTSTMTSVVGMIQRAPDRDFSYAIRAGTLLFDLDDTRRSDDPWQLRSSSASYFVDAEWTSAINRMVGFTYGGMLRFDDIISRTYGDHVERTASLHGQIEFSNLDDITAFVQARLDLINEMSTGRDEFHLSPGVGISYRPDAETAFRILLGRGYRMPTIAERHVNAVVAGAQVEPNTDLYSEVVWHGEAGLAQGMELAPLIMRFDAALYVDEYFSMIEPVLDPSDGNVTFRNVTRGRMLGADLQLSGVWAEPGLEFTGDISFVSARNLKLNTLLPSRPSTNGHCGLLWHGGFLGAGFDYRYMERIEEIDSVLARLIVDADSRNATHNVDLHVSAEMKPLLDLPLTARLHVRNLFQYYHTDGVGSLAPIRSFEVGIEGRW